MSAPAPGAPAAGRSADAVGYLRRRTVGRAFDSYRRWVGRAVGWWTLLYMLFWLVVFGIAGVETLAPFARPLPHPGAVFALGGIALLLLVAFGGRTPPLILDRRDLYRLALAPQRPWDALRWRYGVKQAGGVVAALIVGALWSLVAGPWFGLTGPAAGLFAVPFAAPALALLALFLLDLRWLRYVAHAQHGEHEAKGLALRAFNILAWIAITPLIWLAVQRFLPGGAGGAPAQDGAGMAAPALAPLMAALDPFGALTHASVAFLVVPLLLALASHLCVRATLARSWPPRFAPQSLVLTQVQALRTVELLATLAGAGGGRVADEGERRRLLDALHDRPGATRPRRSLPLPGTQAPQWLALAWRTASALYRRPPLRLVGALLTAFLAVGALLLASGLGPSLADFTAPAAGPASGAGAAGLLGGALSLLFAALFVARAASGLLGPRFDVGVTPVDPLTRSWGRALPALAIFGLLLAPALLGVQALAAALGAGAAAPDALAPALIGAVTLVGIVVLALEKYASWSGAAASRWEPQLVAAMLAALPALLLGALGVGEWTLMTQLLLLGLVAIIPT